MVVTVLLAGVGVYGLIAGPPTIAHPAGSTGSAAPGPVPTGTGSPTAAPPRLPRIGPSSDPETFARNVAVALFSWDTSTGFTPSDYASAVVEGGDPTGAEEAGLASDVTSYLPSEQAWAQLRQYATRQSLTVNTASVPAAWAQAVAEARPGQLAPGTVAYTITGTRHRTGIWNGQTVTSTHDVAFTEFIVCPPNGTRCRLLRLSVLDDALH
ncbi:hypothetical protein [Humibacter ginsenosidimutans]|uniref:hypothetical protein n=1 Tax=Humibacter ginsenosidimutans TaxID=2599293 RepID=UPI00349EFCB5